MLLQMSSDKLLPNPVLVSEQKWEIGAVPFVSVFCLTYNHVHFIRDAIEGFLRQKTKFPFEIIIHDDASSDGTVDIVREYEGKFPHIINPIYQSKNRFSMGDELFTKFLLPKASGRYIAVCEGDDYWIDPLKLQKQVDIFNEYPDTIICGARAKTWSESKKSFTVITPAVDKDITCMTPKQLFYLGDWVKNCTRMIPKDLLLSIPADYMMDYRHVHYILAKKPAGTFRCLDEVVAVYREHSGGVFSGAKHINVQKDYFESTRLIAKLYDDERAIIMRENALHTAKELLLTRSFSSRERIYYVFQFIYLVFRNFSYLGIKRALDRLIYRISIYLDRFPTIKTSLQYFYGFRKRSNRSAKK